MTTDELIQFYSNLLLAQYRYQPKAKATVEAVVSPIIADQIIAAVRDGFDLTTAVGAQLDILGRYVGAQRTLPDYAATIVYFALPNYADADAGTVQGMSVYADAYPSVGEWRLYTSTDGTLTLSDGQMRSLLQYLIALHKSDLSNASIDILFRDFFLGFATVTDNGDMSVTYTHSASTDPYLLFDIVNFIGALPKPAGVLVGVVTV